MILDCFKMDCGCWFGKAGSGSLSCLLTFLWRSVLYFAGMVTNAFHSFFSQKLQEGNSRLFLTPPAEKTKTQGQNSSKKLKKKTQPLGGLSLPFAKLKKKTKIHETFS